MGDLPLLFSGADENSRAPSLSWRAGPPLQFPRYDFSLAGPIGGRLFAVGGSGARRLVEELDVSDLSAFSSRSCSSRSPSRSCGYRSPEVQNTLLSDGWADLHAP